ncbi:serine hydrolase [Pediococcus ethanolidurans]|uniref:serine hydrolase domain-containing protein n=1 Tax=Pediococcus ethanolidurans TaxID=319653 RepID=UPI002955560F|nr:serine hydrolase [Pediococcus ethanolidurans]MDV7720234.1 serine hydrolase [Pediococcus ethanolidurans]
MKKFLIWFFSIVIVVLVFGVGCFVLAKYKTNSMAHRYYESFFENSSDNDLQSNKLTEAVYTVPVATKTDTNAKKVDSALKANNLVGSVAVIRNGKLSYVTTRGQSKYPDGAKNNGTTMYQIGSAQDLITAASVMYLKEHGKLNLNSKLSRYYPEISHAKKITIKQLLNMTSGLSTTAEATATISFPTLLSWNEQHVVSSGVTGSYDYQSVNYVLLAGIIQKASGQPYREFVKAHLLDKLSLKHSGFALNDDQRRKLATPYEDSYSGGKTATAGMTKLQSTKLGPYQMYMSVKDLTTSYFYILSGKLISKTNVKELTQTANSKFSGGVYPSDTGFTVHGQLGGYQDSIQIDTKKQNGVFLLTNYVPTGIKNTQTAPIIYNKAFE